MHPFLQTSAARSTNPSGPPPAASNEALKHLNTPLLNSWLCFAISTPRLAEVAGKKVEEVDEEEAWEEKKAGSSERKRRRREVASCSLGGRKCECGAKRRRSRAENNEGR
jgi:hypothetical protein